MRTGSIVSLTVAICFFVAAFICFQFENNNFLHSRKIIVSIERQGNNVIAIAESEYGRVEMARPISEICCLHTSIIDTVAPDSANAGE